MAQLAMHLSGRYAFLGHRHEVNRVEPVLVRQLGGLHYRSASQRGSVATLLAIVRLMSLVPIVRSMSASCTNNAFLLLNSPEMLNATFLIRMLLYKIYTIHFQ
ncbi:MAG: hypothetical protein WBJ84_01070 [Bacteroidales bacterium]